jgi:predicted dehydrogenase
MSRTNIAIIGCGYWGDKVIETCRRISAISYIKVFDVDSRKLQIVAEKFQGIGCYGSFTEVLQDSTVAAAIVATSASSHFEITSQLLKRGVSVLCEKPLALTSSECIQLGDLCEEHNVKLMVGHTYLFNKSIQFIKNKIEANVIGGIRQLHFERSNFGPVRMDTDVVYDLATHDISIANYIIGSVPLYVRATGSYLLDRKFVDSCCIHLYYANNVSVDIFVSWVLPSKTRVVRIVGDNGVVIHDDMKEGCKGCIYTYNKLYESDRVESVNASKIGRSELPVEVVSPLFNEIEQFLESVLENAPVKADWKNAFDVVKTIEAVQSSIKQNGKRVEV